MGEIIRGKTATTRVKITVEKVYKWDVCPIGFKPGDEFIYSMTSDYTPPEQRQGPPYKWEIKPSFCDWAWNCIIPYVTTLAYGGQIPFYGKNTAYVNCNDGEHPVLFKLELLD